MRIWRASTERRCVGRNGSRVSFPGGVNERRYAVQVRFGSGTSTRQRTAAREVQSGVARAPQLLLQLLEESSEHLQSRADSSNNRHVLLRNVVCNNWRVPRANEASLVRGIKCLGEVTLDTLEPILRLFFWQWFR